MTNDEILKMLDNIKVGGGHQRRAPHKALLILFALGKVVNEPEKRLLHYRDVEPELIKLLEKFGPPRNYYNPQDPFSRLTKDGIWEVPQYDKLDRLKSDPDRIRQKALKEADAQGGFTQKIHSQFSQDKGLVLQATNLLLYKTFPASYHADVLEAVGLNNEFTVIAQRGINNSQFHDEVLNAYLKQCAICGYDISLRDESFGLEPTHIRWNSHKGPDEVSNGLALCTVHHKALDYGGISLSEDLTVQVSPLLTGKGIINERWFQPYKNRPIFIPQKTEDHPSQKYLHWHRKEVFKS